ncbi:MAG: response regulator [Bryobacteraceae bacterium]
MRNCILFISPRAEDVRTLSMMLDPSRVTIRHAAGLRQALELLAQQTFPAILTESHLPDGDWRDVVQYVRQNAKRTAVIVTDRFADVRFWIDVLEGGAYDLLPQPFYRAEVERILASAMTRPQVNRALPAA